MNLIVRVLTKEVIWRISDDWIFCFTEWILFGVQSSLTAQLVYSSIIWITSLLARQHLAKWPIFPPFVHFFPLAGHSCCLDRFGAPQRLQPIFLNFAGLSGCSSVGLVLRLFRERIFFSSSVSGESFNLSYMYSCIASVIPATDISLFLIFLFMSKSPVNFLMLDKNFDARSSAAVIVSKSQFFSNSSIRFHTSAAVSPSSRFKPWKFQALTESMKSALPWCTFLSGVKCSRKSV